MSKTEISFKNNFIKVNNNINNIDNDKNEREIFNEKNPIKNDFNTSKNNEQNNDIENKDNDNNEKNNKKDNNYSFNESNPNYSLFRECFNYYLSYYYEKDFVVDEKDEPQNAGFFARLFGNHPKIYQILPELKSERNFIMFLRNNVLSRENDMFNKIFGNITNFIENSITDLNIEEDKIFKKKNPLNLIKRSYKILNEKMKSFNEMMKLKNDKDIFEEFNINSIPLLMIMQLLYIIDLYPNFIESFINKCFPNEKEIILAFSFYLSSIEYDRLLSGRLNIFFNRDKIVFDKYNEFYLGLFEQSFELFESNKNSLYESFSGIKSEAENMPSSIFWKSNTFKLKYPSVKADSSLSHYFNSSSLNLK
jgi:hypothetical protein